MYPATPAPDDGKVRIPIDAKLKLDWRYDASRGVFVSEKGDEFRTSGELPRRSRIVHKIPSLAESSPGELSSAERDLQRYLQVILPHGKSAAKYLAAIRAWPPIAEAQVGPDISLP